MPSEVFETVPKCSGQKQTLHFGFEFILILSDV